MFASVAIGAVAAIVASLPALFERSHLLPEAAWRSPMSVLAVATLAMLIQHFVVDRRPLTRGYDGLADLFIHVHAPTSTDSPFRWLIRGFISLLLAAFGAVVGPEGAAIEMTHAMAIQLRDASARWNEQRRRTDAASALAAGFSAAFGAPFAAILVPIELGIGGRTLSVTISSLTAFLGAQVIARHYALVRPDLTSALTRFTVQSPGQWGLVAVIAVAAGVFGAVTVRMVRYFQDGLLDLFQTQAWMRTLAGGILVSLVTLIYPHTHFSGTTLMERAFWGQLALGGLFFLGLAQLLILAAVLSGFGTIGIFWPTLAMGGVLGLALHQIAWNLGLNAVPYSGAAALVGGTAFWSAILGNPISSAVAAYELSGNPGVVVPCYLAAWLALMVRKRLRTPTLFDKDLEARGMALLDGKSRKILEALTVRDAMVTDHDTVHEQEPVAELHARLLKSRYPFLPVVSSQGIYRGLLTIDMVRDAWKRQDARGKQTGEPLAVTISLSRLLEAKDLLYRSTGRVRTVRASDRLTAGVDSSPCLPVLADDGRVVGLLFAYHLRLTYDREVARRSLGFDTAAEATP